MCNSIMCNDITQNTHHLTYKYIIYGINSKKQPSSTRMVVLILKLIRSDTARL